MISINKVLAKGAKKKVKCKAIVEWEVISGGVSKKNKLNIFYFQFPYSRDILVFTDNCEIKARIIPKECVS
jgi:hypothetical protein